MSTYADRQAERDSAYSTAYCAWVASLAPAERAQLAAGGLSDPDATRHTCTRQHDDVTLDRTAAPNNTRSATTGMTPSQRAVSAMCSTAHEATSFGVYAVPESMVMLYAPRAELRVCPVMRS